MYSKIFLQILLSVFLLEAISCKKEPANIDPVDNGPLKATALTPLPDDIPYGKLGSGKIVFQRFYDYSDEVEFYVIDINQGKSSGFRMNSQIKQPNISRDGKKIVCSLLDKSDLNTVWGIYSMNIDGTECVPVYKSDKNASYPTWDSNSSRILFYTGKPDGSLYMQTAVENATDRVEMIKFNYPDDAEWGIIPSGAFSYSSAGKITSVSTSKSLDGVIGVEPYIGKAGASLLVTPSDLSDGILNYWIESAVFSLDGSKIAFLALYQNPGDKSWVGYNIFFMNADGTNLTSAGGSSGYPLTIDLDGSLCWSPDGTKILFTFNDSPTSSHLFVLNVDGNNEGGYIEVTNLPFAYDTNVSWSY